MAKPVILAVGDDPRVLRAAEVKSGASALDTLGKLKLRGDPVALFLVDQRTPEVTCVEFLEEAIRAISEVDLDY